MATTGSIDMELLIGFVKNFLKLSLSVDVTLVLIWDLRLSAMLEKYSLNFSAIAVGVFIIVPLLSFKLEMPLFSCFCLATY